MRSVSAGHWKLTMTNWEQSLKSILLQLHEKLLNSMLTIQWLFSLWSKLERWKSLISGCLASWSQIKKSHHLEMSYLTACNNNQPVLNWIVTCDEKWLLYNSQQWQAQRLDREEAPEHFPKQNLHQKRSWPFGGLLLVWSTTAFWILAKPLHLRSMLSKLMRCAENYSACSQHWSVGKVQFCSMTVPDLPDHTRLHNQCFENWANWAMNFCLICHIANWPLLQVSWQLFAVKMLPQPAGGRKCFPTVHWILKHRFLCYRNKQTYFLLVKMCWLLWFLYWLIKMCLSLVIMI